MSRTGIEPVTHSLKGYAVPLSEVFGGIQPRRMLWPYKEIAQYHGLRILEL